MSADKMPPLPGAVIVDRHIPTGVVMYANTPDQIRAYARAYAAEQTRELVETLERINEWCCYATEEDINARLLALQQIGQTAREAIAKHKGAA